MPLLAKTIMSLVEQRVNVIIEGTHTADTIRKILITAKASGSRVTIDGSLFTASTLREFAILAEDALTVRV